MSAVLFLNRALMHRVTYGYLVPLVWVSKEKAGIKAGIKTYFSGTGIYKTIG